MTTKEHDLILLMFARMLERMGIIAETFKSRGIWTDDDGRAFSHLVHDDTQKMLRYASVAMREYLECAKVAGVVTGIDDPPDAAPLP